MRNATAAFKRAIASGRRDYQNRAVITLSDGTVLTGTKTTWNDDTGAEAVETVNYLTNENIWSDGLSVEDAVSNDNVFQIGAAIINQCKLTLNNIYDEYTEYDFKGATVKLYVGLNDLDDGTSDEVQMGTYVVDSAEYDSGIVTLTCLDNMSKFDKPYTNHIVYPATLGAIVRDCCNRCGVAQSTTYLTFPHSTYTVQRAPSGESTTHRQVLSWAMQIAGCFARCNALGQLEIKFYDFAGLTQAQTNLDGGTFDDGTPSYASGDDADGGSFNPWDTGYVYDAGGFVGGPQVHLISSDFASKVSLDDVVITQIRVSEKVNSSLLSSYAPAYSNKATYSLNAYVYYENDLYQCIRGITTPEEFNREHWKQITVITRTSGTAGYTIAIEDNGLIMGNAAQKVANLLITDLGGIRFRPANITHPSDPTIEAGDVALFWDRKGTRHAIIVSSTNFTSGASQNTVSSAETPARNSAQRFTQATANYVAMREQVEQQARYLSQAINNSTGLYCTQETQPDGSVITYYHEKKLKSDSELVMSFSTAGFSVTADYQTPQTQGGPTWYGITFDGQFFASVLSASGINADWIDTGELSGVTIRLGNNLDEDGRLVVSLPSSNSSIVIDGDGFYTSDASGSTSGSRNIWIEEGVIGFLDSQVEISVFGETANYDENGNEYPISLPQVQFIAYSDGVAMLYEESGDFRNGLAVKNGTTYLWGDFVVAAGTKSRAADTDIDGQNLLYCYETPTPYFGDIGTGRTDENGNAIISIDGLFAETINASIEYCVFLQKEGAGDIWVSEKEYDYFSVNGTPNLPFSWEIKAPQAGYEMLRLDNVALAQEAKVDDDDLEHELDEDLRKSDLEYETLFS